MEKNNVLKNNIGLQYEVSILQEKIKTAFNHCHFYWYFCDLHTFRFLLIHLRDKSPLTGNINLLVQPIMAMYS